MPEFLVGALKDALAKPYYLRAGKPVTSLIISGDNLLMV